MDKRIDSWERDAEILIDAENYEEAQETLKKILLVERSHHLAAFKCGSIAMKLGNMAEALAYLKRAIETNPRQEGY